MPRESRCLAANVPVHITQRGNNKQNIFHSDEDKGFYLKAFMKYKRKYRIKVYAWCLMDNHIHVVLESPSAASISKLFHDLNTKYVMYYNRVHKKSGRLFGDRFFSSLLSDEHMYEAIRYVELNPYRARMEAKVADYPWTSAHERLGKIQTRFLSSIKGFFDVGSWIEYLMDAVTGEIESVREKWAEIRSRVKRNMPVGNERILESWMEKLPWKFNLQFKKLSSW